MYRKSTTEAAELIAAAYAGRLRFSAANSEPGAQALITPDRDLVIPGTNECEDWRQFNLQVYPVGKGTIPGLQLVPLADIASWHFGFLRHADSVYRFARHFRPRFIVGHSLGGAAAQIIGQRMRLPAITFAAPRVYRGGARYLHGEGWILNLCRSDDPVTGAPTLAGFRHLGTTRRFNTGRPVSARNHPTVIGQTVELSRIEREWPRVA